MPGFQSVNGRVEREQAVAVGLTDPVVGIFPLRVIGVELWEILNQARGQPGQIGGRAVVLRVGQAGRISKRGSDHTQALGLAIHPLRKDRFAPSDGFCECDRSIVSGLDNHAVEQFLYAGRLVGLDKHSRTDGLPSRLGYRGTVIQFQRSVPNRRKAQIGREQFGQRCGVDPLIGRFRGQHLTGGHIQHEPGLGCDWRNRHARGKRG